jgi:hypothetical protein
MRTYNVCIASALLAFSLGACVGPVMQPLWGIDLPPTAVSPDDSKAEITAAVNDIAMQVGFTDRHEHYEVTGGGQEFFVYWHWPEHPSTYITLARHMHSGPDVYTVLVGDDQTEGRYLIGPACEKYLRIIALVKARFGDGIKLQEASCDPARPPAHW